MQNTSLIDVGLFSPRRPSACLLSLSGGKIVEEATKLIVFNTKKHDRASLLYRRPEAPVSPYRYPDAPIYFYTLYSPGYETKRNSIQNYKI